MQMPRDRDELPAQRGTDTVRRGRAQRGSASGIDPLMVDQGFLTFWNLLGEVVTGGVRTYRHWRTRDGLPFAPRLPAHQHTMPTLVVGLSGLVRVRGLLDLSLLPGDMVLIEPGCWHDHAPMKAGSSSFGLGFLAGRCDVIFTSAERTLWGCVPEQPYRKLVNELMKTTEEAVRLRIIDEILSHIRAEEVGFIDWIHPGVLKMAAFAWNHMHESIEATDLVAEAGLCRTAAFDLFKEFFGRSPKQEILAQRMDLAMHLLRSGYSVTECADRCGFTTRSDLTRAFRLRFGFPPTRFQ